MATTRSKLSKKALKNLKSGEVITERGIRFERIRNGDGRFTLNKMINGKRIHRVIGLESEGVTLLQAEETLEKLATEQRAGRLRLPEKRKLEMRFSEAIPLYLERLNKEGGKDLERKRHRLTTHILPFFKHTPMVSLTSSDINRYRASRKEFGAKPATINRELATLSHLINMAVEWGWIAHRPCPVRMEQEDNRKLTYLTREQCQRLLQAAIADRNPQIYLFIRIGLETGMRRSEILTIRIENLNLEQGFIYLPSAKAGARNQPVGKELAEVISSHINEQHLTGPWLFPSIGKTPSKYGYTTSIEEPFRRVVAAAGLDPKIVTPHVMRHTVVTHLTQVGTDWTTVMAISGHKTLSMVQRYSHHASPLIDKALTTLNNGLEEQSSEQTTQELHREGVASFLEKLQTLSGPEFKAHNKNYPFLYAFRNSLYEAPVYLEGLMDRVLGEQCAQYC